ncbi:MAG: hypothetical protein CMA63_00290 [Euryarchaeota archaeon]|nr:hypothetical protein [Euryarchaeota archaeon]
MRRNISYSILVVLLMALASPMLVPAQAHTASAFTVLVQENSFSQQSPEIIQNDSIIWFNTDNSSNLTHRLVFDADGDGLYNGIFEWDSGELHAYCETDENNTKIDPDCSTSFMVVFDTNWTAGDYDYQDIRSDGSVLNGTIRLFADEESHMNSSGPVIGSSFGVQQNDDSADDEIEDDPLSAEQLLLYVAISTGIASVLLFALLLVRRSPESDIEVEAAESDE